MVLPELHSRLEMLSPKDQVLALIHRASEGDDLSATLTFLDEASKILRDSHMVLEDTGMQKSDIYQIAFSALRHIDLNDQGTYYFHLAVANTVMKNFPLRS